MKNQRGSLHIALLGIAIILILGGAFFLLTAKKPSEVQPTSLVPMESLSPTPLPTLSSSDEVNAIDKDIQNTQVTQDDPEMKSIESDLTGL